MRHAEDPVPLPTRRQFELTIAALNQSRFVLAMIVESVPLALDPSTPELNRRMVLEVLLKHAQRVLPMFGGDA